MHGERERINVLDTANEVWTPQWPFGYNTLLLAGQAFNRVPAQFL